MKKKKPHTFPTIDTDRIRLRRLVVRDISRIMTLANNPKIEEMTLSFPYPYREKDAISWLATANAGFEEKNHFIFAIALLPKNDFIGGIGLRINTDFNRAEVGFWLGEPYWDNGYITEALGNILAFGFQELELHKIYGFHLDKNPASGRVMEKNGMIREAKLIDHIKKGDEYFDAIQYRLTREEFQRNQQ